MATTIGQFTANTCSSLRAGTGICTNITLDPRYQRYVAFDYGDGQDKLHATLSHECPALPDIIYFDEDLLNKKITLHFVRGTDLKKFSENILHHLIICRDGSKDIFNSRSLKITKLLEYRFITEHKNTMCIVTALYKEIPNDV